MGKYDGLLGIKCFKCGASPDLLEAIVIVSENEKPEDIICDNCK